MNELFPPVPEAQEIVRQIPGLAEVVNHELLFTGDQAAFRNSNFRDFFNLLTENAVWLNQNILACTKELSVGIYYFGPSAQRLFKQQQLYFIFDLGKFVVCYRNKPQESDVQMIDMLLESLGQQGTSLLEIGTSLPYMTSKRQIFSTGGLQRFFKVNSSLKTLKLSRLEINPETCDSIGITPSSLDALTLAHCQLQDAQQFALGFGANVCGPTKLCVLSCTDVSVDYASFIVPLLGKTRLSSLEIDEHFLRSGDLQAVKAAFKCNRSLSKLRIEGYCFTRDVQELNLFFHGMASCQHLRTFDMNLKEYRLGVSPQQQSESFATALMDCCNNSLEVVDTLIVNYTNRREKEIWNKKVVPILAFNHKRRLFEDDSTKREMKLARALASKEDMDNDHFRYWLVLNHAGNLCCGSRGGRKKQTISPQGSKRKLNSH
jgi:hypothetical protein